MAYKKVTVKIPNVTGNIVVNVATQGSIQNLFDVNNSILNARIGAAGDLKDPGSANGMIITNLIDTTDFDKIVVSGLTFIPNTTLGYSIRVFAYDAETNSVYGVNYSISTSMLEFDIAEMRAVHTNAKYVRFGLSVKDGTSITVDDVANLVIIGS